MEEYANFCYKQYDFTEAEKVLSEMQGAFDKQGILHKIFRSCLCLQEPRNYI